MMMNCLVAGPTQAGKTILSRRLVKEHGYARIPGDAVVLAFEKTFPELRIGHERKLYESTRKQFGRFLVQFMNALAWAEDAPYVVDTFHVWPTDLEGIDRATTIVLFLGYPEADPQEKMRRAKQYQDKCDGKQSGWVAESPEAVSARFTLFIEMSRKIREECAACHFPFLDTGHAFEEAISGAVAQVISQGRGDD
jgi:adenylate kinase family enzyme